MIRGGFRVNYVNDEYLRAPDAFDQANSGLGALVSTFSNTRAALTPRGPDTAPFQAVPVFTTRRLYSSSAIVRDEQPRQTN